LTPGDDGLVVGIVAGAAKVSLRLPAAGIGPLARRLLEALHAMPSREYDGEDFERMRELLISDEDRARMLRIAEDKAERSAQLALEKDRLAAIEQGRKKGAVQWAQTVCDLAVAVSLEGIERTLELQRLTPMIIQAREQRLGRG